MKPLTSSDRLFLLLPAVCILVSLVVMKQEAMRRDSLRQQLHNAAAVYAREKAEYRALLAEYRARHLKPPPGPVEMD
ncbi:MAG: hypothetical protein KGJ62_09315 [Armatimonadetes bacterium]|nr:hypothetical protein [Armatimonadota bacterium]MDE2207443.1 hypothetical protein [Armatimonadota bacterium]